MSYVTADDGVKLYYEEAGEGFPIIFVHEFGGDYRSYEPQIRYFARRYRCIAYNARGYPPPTFRMTSRNIRSSGRATTF